MKKSCICSFILIPMILVLFACGEVSSPNSPQNVVQKYLSLLEEGNYTALCALVSKEALGRCDEDSWKSQYENIHKVGGIKKIQTRETNNKVNSIVVITNIRFNSGFNQLMMFLLQKEDGHWKIYSIT